MWSYFQCLLINTQLKARGKRKGAVLKALLLVAFLWAPWSELNAYWNIRHESSRHRTDLLREAPEGREVPSCWCLLPAPWKSAPAVSDNSTQEEVRQDLSTRKLFGSLIMHWICWTHSVNVSEDVVALPPNEGRELWSAAAVLAVEQVAISALVCA